MLRTELTGVGTLIHLIDRFYGPRDLVKLLWAETMNVARLARFVLELGLFEM